MQLVRHTGKALLLIWFLVGVCAVSAAADDLHFSARLYNHDQGLMNPIVECMVRDNDNSLWIGTQDGLYHYNGETFKKYKPTKNDTNSIDNLWIHSLSRDHHGNIWIGTDDGLNMLSKITGKIRRIKLEKGKNNGIIRP